MGRVSCQPFVESAVNFMLIFQLSMSPQNVVFIINVAIHRLWFILTGRKNPSSAPYVSGDTFRSLADHVYDGDSTIDPNSIKRKDIVFVGFSHLQDFFSTKHPYINQPYILISHNGDTTIDKKWTRFIDSKIIHWFSQNVSVKHPKLTPIPIGLENLDYYNHGVPKYFSTLKITNTIKRCLIIFGFSIQTNFTERKKAFDYILNHPNSKQIEHRLNAVEYLKVLNEHAFVLSPPGNGIDCIRTWEALYLGVIPIVKRSVSTEYFKSLGLPLWVIDTWDELDKFSLESLQTVYSKLTKKKIQALYISFWKDKISAYVK